MTDAAAAPDLTDVWNLFLAFFARQPTPLQVLSVLVALVALLMVIDGIRSNFFRRRQPAVEHNFSRPSVSAPHGVRMAAAPRKPMQTFKVKRVRKISRHKAPRPTIHRTTLGQAYVPAAPPVNRVVQGLPPAPPVHQPSPPKSLREQIGAPL